MTKTYLNDQGIHVFYTNNAQTKSNYAEAVIKNLKRKIYSLFTEHETYRYIDVLQDLVFSYNHTPHQSLGNIAPATVSKTNESEIRYIQYLVREKKSNKNSTKESLKMKKRRKPNQYIDTKLAIWLEYHI